MGNTSFEVYLSNDTDAVPPPWVLVEDYTTFALEGSPLALASDTFPLAEESEGIQEELAIVRLHCEPITERDFQ